MWNLADRIAPLGRRQSRAALDALIQGPGLDREMKLFGVWDDFVAGRRGRVAR